MNELEIKMMRILERGRKEHGYIGVKAEFEAEGTRLDELLRLVEISRKAGVKIGLKIGGCEAIRDMLEAKQIGVDYIISPMIETPYALSKYIDAKNKVYNDLERAQTGFLFNLETDTSYKSLDSMIPQATIKNGVNGIVFGRVDYTLSKKMNRNDINNDVITEHCINTAQLCKASNLEFVVGGGIAKEAIPALKRIKSTFLTRFETRKVIFSAAALDNPNIEDALEDAVMFELLWLKNKQAYYYGIGAEDESRIKMLESRIKVLETC